MDGLVVIDKPAGLTSHDVVDRVRRVFGTRRVGHGGTLDPAATGVLVVLIGAATRLAEYLLAGEKAYRFRVRFGLETTTYDLDGEVVREEDASGVGQKALEGVLGDFLGERKMAPPLASAVRQNGRRLYDWARRGIEVDRPARAIRIEELNLLAFCAGSPHPEAELFVRCSKGTYVRSLAVEIGQAMGTVGTVIELRRVAASGFTLEDSVELEALEKAAAAGTADSYLLPMDRALKALPAVELNDTEERRFRLGSSCSADGLRLAEEAPAYRVYGPGGFVGVGALLCRASGERWILPKKVLRTAGAGEEKKP